MSEKTITLELETWGDIRIWTIRETGHDPDEDGITDPVADMIPEHDRGRAIAQAIKRGQRVGWKVLEMTDDGREIVKTLWEPLQPGTTEHPD